MSEQSANLAYSLFRDLRELSFPTFACGITLAMRLGFGSWSDNWRKAVLICGAIQFLGLTFFALGDGSDILRMIKIEPPWGTCLVLGLLATIVFSVMAWQLKSKNDLAASQGLWELAESHTEKLGRLVTILGIVSAVLLLTSLFWLWLLSRGHDSFV